jgi:hypothetical protein
MSGSKLENLSGLQWIISSYRKTGCEGSKKICPGNFKQESGFIVIGMMFNKITFDKILTPGIRIIV